MSKFSIECLPALHPEPHWLKPAYDVYLYIKDNSYFIGSLFTTITEDGEVWGLRQVDGYTVTHDNNEAECIGELLASFVAIERINERTVALTDKVLQ